MQSARHSFLFAALLACSFALAAPPYEVETPGPQQCDRRFESANQCELMCTAGACSTVERAVQCICDSTAPVHPLTPRYTPYPRSFAIQSSESSSSPPLPESTASTSQVSGSDAGEYIAEPFVTSLYPDATPTSDAPVSAITYPGSNEASSDRQFLTRSYITSVMVTTSCSWIDDRSHPTAVTSTPGRDGTTTEVTQVQTVVRTITAPGGRETTTQMLETQTLTQTIDIPEQTRSSGQAIGDGPSPTGEVENSEPSPTGLNGEFVVTTTVDIGEGSTQCLPAITVTATPEPVVVTVTVSIEEIVASTTNASTVQSTTPPFPTMTTENVLYPIGSGTGALQYPSATMPGTVYSYA